MLGAAPRIWRRNRELRTSRHLQPTPWSGLDAYDDSDPSRFLSGVSTPTLVLHGDADRRVPFAQGLTLYRALADQGVETELWVYPGQGHGLRSAAHNVHRLDVWADWYDAHR